MSEIETTSLNIRQIRDELVEKKGSQKLEIERGLQAKGNIEKFFATLSPEKLDKLEANGIYVRELMNFDLDEVSKSKELSERFMQSYLRILQQINELANRKRSEGA